MAAVNPEIGLVRRDNSRQGDAGAAFVLESKGNTHKST